MIFSIFTYTTKRFYILGLLFSIFIGIYAQENIPVPTPSQLKWQNAEMGALFHYDLHVFDGVRYEQNKNRIIPFPNYNLFNPKHLDTDQWVKAAKRAGCKFALITATHETGFGLWQSDVNPYSMKCLKWKKGKGDIIRDFIKSCRKYHIEPGIYVGIRWNSLLGIHNFLASGTDSVQIRERQQWYKHYCEAMVKELCTKYGPLFMIWFDGGADDPKGDGPNVEPIINKYQPNCLFYHNVDRADIRWGGSEGGRVSYPCSSNFPTPYSHHKFNESGVNHRQLLQHGDVNGKYYMPAMADTPLRGANGRHEWFWEPGDENAVCSLTELMDIYDKSVGRNATLVLGITPDTCGLVPKIDAERLKEFGRAIQKRYAHPIAETSGQGDTLFISTKTPTIVDRYIVCEDCRYGERVLSYQLEAKTSNGWLCIDRGTIIGNKRIGFTKTSKAQEFRLIINQSKAIPYIKKFAIYSTRP